MDVEDLLRCHARVDSDAAEPVLQPSHVAVGLEEATVHDARHLVDAVAEDEAAVVDGQGRTFARQELAVEINHTWHV